jgi:aspartate/methionine/tyrosine aminotransferase
MVMPEDRVRDVEKLAQNAFICPSAPAQHAAMAAFREDTLQVLEGRRVELQRRRDFLVPALRRLGFSVPVMPTGAFYIYANCERFGADSSALAFRMLEESGVAVTPGVDFGAYRAQEHLRFAYTRSLADLEEGVVRMEKLLAR